MDSPLVRVILATLGGYLVILLLWSAYDWVREEYPQRPAERVPTERVQHPIHHHGAIDALERFSRLPKPEKTTLEERLQSELIPLEQWLQRMGRSRFQMMCLGELHEEATRRFLANEFFTGLNVDALMLEATPGQLERLLKRLEAGRDYFPLLNADIMNILRAVQNRNPAVKIYGIEATDKQARQPHGSANARDQVIAQNFWTAFKPGRRHIVLFGALHCSNESNWFYQTLFEQASRPVQDRMLNAWVLGEHQNGPLEAFVFFLDEIGIEKRHFVIPNTRRLPSCIYEWFPFLNRQLLMKYRSLIVFRA
jgi:hypothetical protein